MPRAFSLLCQNVAAMIANMQGDGAAGISVSQAINARAQSIVLGEGYFSNSSLSRGFLVLCTSVSVIRIDS